MVTTLRAAGVPAREIAEAIPQSRFLSVDGSPADADLREAFALNYPKFDPGRWFLDNPVRDEGRTWIVTKMWAETLSQSWNVSPSLRQSSPASGTKRSRHDFIAKDMYIGACPRGTRTHMPVKCTSSDMAEAMST
jgi:hypothetical protein